MSNEELDDTPTEKPRERTLTVKVEKDPDVEQLREERDKFRQIVEDLAQKAFQEKKDDLKEAFPNFADEIDELSPDDLASFELTRLREELAKPETTKKSTGSVSLHKPSKDPVSEMFSREYDSAEDMLTDLVNLGYRRDLTAEQRQRIENAKNVLWHKFNTSKTQPQTMTVAEKLPDSERFYKCRFCGRYIDHNQRTVHSSMCSDKFSEVVK